MTSTCATPVARKLSITVIACEVCTKSGEDQSSLDHVCEPIIQVGIGLGTIKADEDLKADIATRGTWDLDWSGKHHVDAFVGDNDANVATISVDLWFDGESLRLDEVANLELPSWLHGLIDALLQAHQGLCACTMGVKSCAACKEVTAWGNIPIGQEDWERFRAFIIQQHLTTNE